MTSGDRDGLITRIRQIRRLAQARDQPPPNAEAEIQAQIQPGALGAALADDARHRGL
jgi:hypothetical protein